MIRIRTDIRGFTLLELLLSILMLTIILGAIYSTFFLSHKAVDGINDSLLRLQESRMMLDVLAREVESSVYDGSRQKSVLKIEDRDIYGKQASRFAFTTLSLLRPGMSLLQYNVEEHDGKLVLYKTLLDPYRNYTETEAPKPVALLEDIDSFTVECKNGTDWVKTWDTAETKKAPDEIRITLAFKVRDKPITLYETMKPKIGKPL
ncbi:MAG: prepilin-type N-terminal cleavage/methylation domain-containing protein [Nitrospiraceae bacterium]|nr:prepilin-type N-terminal cleavage/methylation domain-containing protein [Nitrospiraceae bacterium]